ncbi:MAG: 30S ribosome-binding factor RbfA [Deltaproteobacteria bacterium]|nr:30S ribosome-binding factor RbfA [Deltaproteobacteria bacterium]
MSHRPVRLGGVIQRELTTLLQRGKLKDPRISALTTFTGVELSKDLSHATVYFSVMGQEERVSETEAGLVAARGFLQRHLARVLEVRSVPALRFAYDTSLDRGARMEEILSGLPELSSSAPAAGADDEE